MADKICYSPLSRLPLITPVLHGVGYVARRYAFTPLSNTATIHGYRMKLGRWSYVNTPLFVNETYEPGTYRIFNEILRPRMTVVDLGANIGFYTLLAAKLVGPEGRIYAFEASPDNFEVLEENIRLNGYDNVIAVNKAVLNREGVVKLWTCAEDSASHTLFRNPGSSDIAVEVEAITLDSYFEEIGWPCIDLIKMDIEGAEPFALEGMNELISKMNSLKLIIELYPYTLKAAGLEPKDFLVQLQRMGFVISVIRDPYGLRPVNSSQLLEELGETGILNLFCEWRGKR